MQFLLHKTYGFLEIILCQINWPWLNEKGPGGHLSSGSDTWAEVSGVRATQKTGFERWVVC